MNILSNRILRFEFSWFTFFRGYLSSNMLFWYFIKSKWCLLNVVPTLLKIWSNKIICFDVWVGRKVCLFSESIILRWYFSGISLYFRSWCWRLERAKHPLNPLFDLFCFAICIFSKCLCSTFFIDLKKYFSKIKITTTIWNIFKTYQKDF